MTYGAAVLAAKQHGAAELVDPRPFAVGTIAKTFEDYPHVGQAAARDGLRRASSVEDLRETIDASDAELVLIGTPIDLRKIVDLDSRRCGSPTGWRRSASRRSPHCSPNGSDRPVPV